MTTAVLDRADTKCGFISGVASSPAIDAYGHSVKRGAFDASIAKRGLSGPSSVKLLEGHAGLPIGRITRLHTVGVELRLEGELNMELSRARDLHSIIKHSGGLNFSVGFRLEEFDVDEKAKPGEPWLIIRRGDLTEISIVTFPACAEATMDAKSRAMAPWVAKALAEMQRTHALFDPKPVDRLAELQAQQLAILTRIAEIRGILRKRQRDAETLRQWRHWSDERKRSLPARLNLI